MILDKSTATERNTRSFRLAAWLGWQIESNWTDPFLFAVYSIVKPLAGAAILVVMYSIITQNNFESPVFPYIYIGNAFFQYVAAVMTGVSWAIIDDREHYRTLKYIYIAPISVPYYLMGRGVARFITASFAVIITMTVGVLLLGLRIDLQAVNWGLFIAGVITGTVMLALMGLFLAGVTLIVARHSYFIGDVVAGVLFLFSGVVYPLDVLPAFLRPIGYIMPTTYWLELIRRAIVPEVAGIFPTFASLNNLEILAILAGLTLLFGMLAVFGFRRFDWQAREAGLIDQVTNY